MVEAATCSSCPAAALLEVVVDHHAEIEVLGLHT